MKAKWTSLVSDLQGGIDDRHYARHIPGNSEWAAVCSKPELSKKTKKSKAAHATCKNFSKYIAICSEILRDPARKASWEAQYEAAKRKARRYQQPIQGRLIDYLRHEVSLALREGREIM